MARSATERPTVTLVAHEIHDRGGMERALSDLIRHSHRQFRFVVHASELQPDLQPLVEFRKIRTPRRPFPLRFAVFFIRAGLRLRSDVADIVHTQGAIVPNRADFATVHFCHAGFRSATGALAPPEAPPLRRLNTTIARSLALLAEHWAYRPGRLRAFGAVSAGVSRELSEHYRDVEVLLTPNGIDTARFRRSEEARHALRSAEGVSCDQVVALFVGGDWDRKGLAYAIDGIAIARARGCCVRLWVVGPGDEERFRQLAQRAGVGDRIRFFGPQRETERFYQAADVFVLPTLYEVFPMVVLEAAASGLPIVATRVSGIEDLIGLDEAGILVSRSGAEIGSALERVACDPELRTRMGVVGEARARSFTPEASTNSVLRAYAHLLGSGRDLLPGRSS